MPQLQTGSTYKLVISEIHKLEFFESKALGHRKYCHIFTADDAEGTHYKCQLCSDFPDSDPAIYLGSLIQLTIKSFTRNVYTIEGIHEVGGAIVDRMTTPPSEEKSKTGPVPIPNKNPMVAGSLADRSLAHAINFYGMEGVSIPFLSEEDYISDVLKTADKIHEWLSGKIS